MGKDLTKTSASLTTTLRSLRAISSTQGKSYKVIAYEMQMSENVVQVRNIMKMTQSTNRTELAYRAHGLWPRERERPAPGGRHARGYAGAVSA